MKKAGEILKDMGTTFEERGKVYGENYKLVGPVMKAMFPEGIKLNTAEDYELWHLFELKIVKLTRFAVSNLTHIDSIHDDAIYGAMIESILTDRLERKKEEQHDIDFVKV